MPRKALGERNEKRRILVERLSEKRAHLKKILKNPATSEQDFYATQRELNELPRDSSKVRLRNRCAITSRSRAYMRKFGVCRNVFREWALDGKIPGVTKSSW